VLIPLAALAPNINGGWRTVAKFGPTATARTSSMVGHAGVGAAASADVNVGVDAGGGDAWQTAIVYGLPAGHEMVRALQKGRAREQKQPQPTSTNASEPGLVAGAGTTPSAGTTTSKLTVDPATATTNAAASTTTATATTIATATTGAASTTTATASTTAAAAPVGVGDGGVADVGAGPRCVFAHTPCDFVLESTACLEWSTLLTDFDYCPEVRVALQLGGEWFVAEKNVFPTKGYGVTGLQQHTVLTMVLLGERYTWYRLNPKTLALVGPPFKLAGRRLPILSLFFGKRMDVVFSWRSQLDGCCTCMAQPMGWML
jgi:hypothetical protein